VGKYRNLPTLVPRVASPEIIPPTIRQLGSWLSDAQVQPRSMEWAKDGTFSFRGVTPENKVVEITTRSNSDDTYSQTILETSAKPRNVEARKS
jgi:hypothetical protein